MQYLKYVQEFALYLFFLSLNFEMFEPLNSEVISLTKLTGIIYFITILPEIKEFLRTDGFGDILALIFTFFALLTFINLLNVNEVSSEFFNFSIFQNIILFWLLVNHVKKDYLILEKGMLYFLYGSFSVALMYFAGFGVSYIGGRLTMFFENSNTLGIKMTICLIILMVTIVQDRAQLGKIRYLLLLFVPFMLDFILATGSRVSIIALILSVVVLIILFKTNNFSEKIVASLIGIFGLVMLGYNIIQSDLVRDRLIDSAEKGDLAGRDEIWEIILPLVKEHPIFGVGDTGYAFYTNIAFGHERSPHNVILELLCLTGFVGLSIFLIFLYKVMIKGFQTYKKDGQLLSILLAIPILGLILGGQLITRKMGWVIFAYMVSVSAIRRTTKQQKID